MDKISKDLSKTIEESTLQGVNQSLEDVLSETGETIINKATENIIEGIPIVKTLIIVPSIFKGISNYLLCKKIIRFLTQIESISVEERKKFLDELQNRQEIIENLMLVIEKHDNYAKSEIQGKIFRDFVKGLINEQDYNSLTYATSIINTQNLERLINFYKNVQPGTSPQMTAELLYYFSFLQLITVDNSQIGLLGGGGPRFKHNDLGKKYVELISS